MLHAMSMQVLTLSLDLLALRSAAPYLADLSQTARYSCRRHRCSDLVTCARTSTDIRRCKNGRQKYYIQYGGFLPRRMGKACLPRHSAPLLLPVSTTVSGHRYMQTKCTRQSRSHMFIAIVNANPGLECQNFGPRDTRRRRSYRHPQ